MNQAVHPNQFQSRPSASKKASVAVLDIGSSKITCLLADLPVDADGEHGRAIVTGFGHQISEGIRGGQITDMVKAEESIRAAVDHAERMAETEIRKVIVGVASGRLVSNLATAEIAIQNQVVTDDHLALGLQHAAYELETPDHEIVHAIPINYSVDDSHGIGDPRGMVGDVLQVNMLTVATPLAALRNLRSCIERCHLECEKFVLAPYASALASLSQDEMDLGVLHIDMGATTTSFTLFYESKPMFMGVVPAGGLNVTRDLALGLNIPVASAERVKNLFGSALDGGSEDIELPTGHGGAHIVQHHMLTRIIRPRLEEILELITAKLDESGLAELAGRRVVLAGGAAQLSGARELAQQILNRDVRVATPMRLNGLPEMAGSPAFSVGAGLIAYARQRDQFRLQTAPSGYGRLARLKSWLKRNF